MVTVIKLIIRKMEHSKRSSRIFRSLDIYGDRRAFTLKGNESYHTCTGRVFTTITLILVLLYGTVKLRDLLAHEDSSFQTFKEYDVVNSTQEFTFEELGYNPVVEVSAGNLS